MLSSIHSHYEKVDDLKHQHACCMSWRLQTDRATPTATLLLHGPTISWPKPGVLEQQFQMLRLTDWQHQTCISPNLSPRVHGVQSLESSFYNDP